MGTQNIITKSQSGKLRNSLALFLRWILAFIARICHRFILLITTETIALPFLGLIIADSRNYSRHLSFICFQMVQDHMTYIYLYLNQANSLLQFTHSIFFRSSPTHYHLLITVHCS